MRLEVGPTAGRVKRGPPPGLFPGKGAPNEKRRLPEWETALLPVGESWSMRAEEPSLEGGARPLVERYTES